MRHETLKSLIAACIALALHVSAFPQALAQSSTYRFIRTDEPLRDRNVYLLSVLQGDEVARKAVMEDAQLSRIGAAYRESVRTALSSCGRAVKCLIDALKLSDSDAEQAGAALERMAGPGKALDSAVRVHLRPSGAFQRFAELNDPQLVKAAWNSTVGALNRLYDVYAGGVEPRYPAIDSRLPSVNDDPTALMLRSAAEVALDEGGQGLPFYTLWERIGLDLLVMNQREEAVRFEPLEEGENREALERAVSVKWQAFRYQAVSDRRHGIFL